MHSSCSLMGPQLRAGAWTPRPYLAHLAEGLPSLSLEWTALIPRLHLGACSRSVAQASRMALPISMTLELWCWAHHSREHSQPPTPSDAAKSRGSTLGGCHSPSITTSWAPRSCESLTLTQPIRRLAQHLAKAQTPPLRAMRRWAVRYWPWRTIHGVAHTAPWGSSRRATRRLIPPASPVWATSTN